EADLHAIERDLESIRVRSAAAPGERPTFGDESGGPETMEGGVRAYLDDKPRPLVGSGHGDTNKTEGQPLPAGAEARNVAPPAPTATATASATETDEDTSAPGDGATIDLFGEEQAASEAAALDDDSFFASLRDAVRDDAPLGPRDASERAFF